MTADQVFELVRRIREFSQIPIVFYTYYNLVCTGFRSVCLVQLKLEWMHY